MANPDKLKRRRGDRRRGSSAIEFALDPAVVCDDRVGLRRFRSVRLFLHRPLERGPGRGGLGDVESAEQPGEPHGGMADPGPNGRIE